MNKNYVQYGSGLSCPDGWENFDVSPRLRAERLPVISSLMRQRGKALFPANTRYGNVVSGLPFEDGEVDGVYCSHVLEHLTREDMVIAVRNTFCMLKPGGRFRLVVPDLEWRAKAYVRSCEKQDSNAAGDFLRSAHLGVEVRDRSLFGRLRDVLGNSDHLWMYDRHSMRVVLEGAGFESVRICKFGDSGDSMFDAVEEKNRFFDSGNAELAMEGIKPEKL